MENNENIVREYFKNGNLKKETIKDLGIVRYYNIDGKMTRERTIEEDENLSLKPYTGDLKDLPKMY